MAEQGFHQEYIFIYIECVCGIVFQLMLLIAFILDPLKCFRNSAVFLVANLAVADLSVCLKTLLTIVVDPELKILEYLDHTTIVASLLTILSVAIDRYFMVNNPIQHRLIMNKKKMVIWVIFIWLLSVTESIKQVIMDEEGPYDDLVRHCAFLFIVLATFVFYAVTFISYKKHSRSLSHNNMEQRLEELRIKKEKKFLKSMVIICTIAVVTIVPNAIFGQVILAGGHEEESRNRRQNLIFFAILMVNFVINPVIYFWRLPNYRKTFFIVFTCRKEQ